MPGISKHDLENDLDGGGEIVMDNDPADGWEDIEKGSGDDVLHTDTFEGRPQGIQATL